MQELKGTDKLREAYPKVNQNFVELDGKITDHITIIATEDEEGHIKLSDIPIPPPPTKEDIGLGDVDNVKQMPATYGSIISKSASFTLALTDGDRVLICTNSTAIIITVPANDSVALPVGSQIPVIRQETGTVTFAPSSGVTLSSKDTKRAIDGQHASATLVKTAADTWQLFGALA